MTDLPHAFVSFKPAAMAALTLALVATHSEGQVYDQKIALVGHDSFEIQITGLDSMAAQKIGLDPAELLERMRRRLEKAGITIEAVSDEGARALLNLKIILAHNEELELAVSTVEVLVKQGILDPEGRVLYISTWSSGGWVGASVLGRARSEIEAAATGQIDRFIADYLAVRRAAVKSSPEP